MAVKSFRMDGMSDKRDAPGAVRREAGRTLQYWIKVSPGPEEWVHLVVVTDANGGRRDYRDGKLVAEPNPDLFGFTGTVDEVRLWKGERPTLPGGGR